MVPNSNQQNDIKQVLFNESTQKRQYLRWLFFILLVVLSVFAIKFYFFNTTSKNTFKFETVDIKRGHLTVIVTATGKLEPVTQVEVGVEVSGTIQKIVVDFNDQVKVGQVLATLDAIKLEAQVKQSQAALTSAEAKLLDAQITIVEKHNEWLRLQKTYKMSNGKLPAQQDLDAAEATFKRAEAQEAIAKAQIAEAEAKLSLDQNNLSKATIRSPIDGIVLERRIEIGQTVAASLQTPVMFTLAKNLTEMKLYVDVDEADVGKVSVGQAATFTIDAYPDRHFPATITQIRYAPQNVAGVVTYQTVLSVNNADLSLRPGMTATASIIVQKLENVLLVPNAALRFTPSNPSQNKKYEPSFLEKLLPQRPMNRPPKQLKEKSDEKPNSQIWVVRDNQPVAIKVKAGVSDSGMTEIMANSSEAQGSNLKLKEGLPVIIDTVSPAK